MDSMPVIDRYAYMIPKIYVKSIGAGGGSIAWIDRGGSLRVGPQSAGAVPGPVSLRPRRHPADRHRRAGRARLSRSGFPARRHREAGQACRRARADRSWATSSACRRSISRPACSTSPNSQMADLARKVTVERGLDPRSFVLYAYGGAGPVFAAFLSQHLGAQKAYVPSDSGVFSAFGMLTHRHHVPGGTFD